MTPHVVVDVGNTRVKFGRVEGDRIGAVAALPLWDSGDPGGVVTDWGLTGRLRWAVAGVNPARVAEFVAWARGRGDEVIVIDRRSQVPLAVAVAAPDQVGIDRLLGAVGANRRRRPGRPAVVIDAGSAITVNVLDAAGIFRGGAIGPGLRLMARGLHHFTARLPLIDPEPLHHCPPDFPAGTTRDAILCGLWAAAAGGVRELLRAVARAGPSAADGLGDPAADPNSSGRPPPELFVTGGDGPVLARALADLGPSLVPTLTLEGVCIAAGGLA